MNKFKVALFDLDGTILDTEGEYTEFWGGIGRIYHPEMPDFASIIKGTTLTQIFSKYFPDADIQESITSKLDEWEKGMQYRFVDGAEEFVSFLKSRGVKTAIVTSSNEKKMESVRLKSPSIMRLFDKVLTSEMFSHSKPHPDCYQLGAKVFGVEKEQCIVFEDAFTGLQAGRSAGMFTVGLATTNSPDSIRDKCDFVVDDFTDERLKDFFI